MPSILRNPRLTLLLTVAIGFMAAGCNSNESRGRRIVERMSATLAAAPTFSVTTAEVRERTDAAGERVHTKMTRRIVLRRNPDRLYSETSGDTQNQMWYDGVGITLVVHRDKVFGQARMPETLDGALDAVSERYGIAMALGDFLYSSAADALIAETTKGRWMGREDIEGRPHDRVKFADNDVVWQLWVPVSGQPLPARFVIDYNERRAANHIELNFRDWNLAPVIAASQFEPRVPPDYEGIALLQRAAVLRNIPEDADTEQTEGTASAPR